jgi:hypothetical protein
MITLSSQCIISVPWTLKQQKTPAIHHEPLEKKKSFIAKYQN